MFTFKKQVKLPVSQPVLKQAPPSPQVIRQVAAPAAAVQPRPESIVLPRSVPTPTQPTSRSPSTSSFEFSAGSEETRIALLQKDASAWSVIEVCSWLSCLALSEYIPSFRENEVSGAELMELTDADFESLRVRKLGDKKKILRSLASLKTKTPFGAPSSKSSRSSQASLSDSEDDSDSDEEDIGRVTVKVTRKDKEDGRLFELDNPDMSVIKRRLKTEYGETMIIKAKDKGGELITLQDDSDLRKAVRNHVLSLVVFPASYISENEGKLLQSLVDAVIIIDKRGSILFFNKAAEQTFGYSAKSMIGKNVKVLMTRTDAKNHRGYLKSYLKTGINQVIGRGRNVTCKVADGSTFTARLSVSEIREGDRHTFTGTLHRLEENIASANQIPIESQFMILDAILDASVVINEQGTVQFFNKAAEKVFGYNKKEVHGQNVRMLMPDPFRSEHDVYLSNYHRSKIPKVIGTGRDVPIQTKDGSIMPSNLKLTEMELGNKFYYTGILTPVVDDKPVKSALEVEREVLNGLLIPAVIINVKGIIQAFNGPAAKLFEYSLNEVIGKNISMLMSGTDKVKHDGYLKAYLDTGKSKIIGVGRRVAAHKKSGEAVPCKLWVTEKTDGDRKFYSGLLQPED